MNDYGDIPPSSVAYIRASYPIGKWLEALLGSKVFLGVVRLFLRDGVNGMRRKYAIQLVEYLFILAVRGYSPDLATRSGLVGTAVDQVPFVLSRTQARQHVAGVVCVRISSYGLALQGSASRSGHLMPLSFSSTTSSLRAAGEGAREEGVMNNRHDLLAWLVSHTAALRHVLATTENVPNQPVSTEKAVACLHGQVICSLGRWPLRPPQTGLE